MHPPAKRIFRSPAKINWNLRVLRRCEDGYHAIESLMSAVTLEDEMIFTPRPEAGVTLSCDRADIPTDGRNLILRAAELLERTCPTEKSRSGWHCHLVKQIPVGGGLGGGSSNAAVALSALNLLWKLNLKTEQLHVLAAQLGSDVPFFLCEGSAIVRGRGEQIEPVRLGWRGWIVLICPPMAVATGKVYEAWEPEPCTMPPISQQSDALGEGCDAVAWMQSAYNMLEAPAMKVCPALKDIAQRCAEHAGRPVRLSGSGSTLFTAFDTINEAELFARDLSAPLGLSTDVVQPAEQASHRRLHHGDHGSPNQARRKIN